VLRSVRSAIVFMIVGLFALGVAVAQIDEFRAIDGKTVECLHSGLMSDLSDCGFRSDWYAYVFVGSISAVVPADKKDETKVRITPDEVFHGDPPTPLTVLTSQGLCLPKLTVGDRWLFFLRKEAGKPIVLDYYGNDSRPVVNAQKQIETLRRLKTIGDYGIVRGRVAQGPGFSDRKAVPGAHVVASRKADNGQYSATTNEDGYFEFEPLAPGEYDLTVDRIGSFQPDDDGVKVTSGSCWNLTISRSPHAEIGGHLRHSDGSPVANAPVFIIDGDGYNTTMSESDGYFQSDGMRPGKYLVGINLPDAPAWKYGGCGGAGCEAPPIYLYYPGVHNRPDALVINLAEDEKLDDVDFTIPIH
jgi:hypothetical protein